ncbi:MAG TPA: hypothetical protein QGH67_04865 [Alphaproteobacteria bacterium]|jgi:hypothetical protein|nr:hypothetical protein [Candidatus Paceibacterota bacterium]HJO14103.1 hypothetical protein [Alphaproteobacteria bacterium]|tara:strand:+ start:4877 stop:5152 length:276 start_codon:yes stop_codon:yes gene_type:complete
MLKRQTKFDKLKDRVKEEKRIKIYDRVHGGPLADRNASVFMNNYFNSKPTDHKPRGNYWVHKHNNHWSCVFGDDAMIKNIKAEQDRRNKKL